MHGKQLSWDQMIELVNTGLYDIGIHGPNGVVYRGDSISIHRLGPDSLRVSSDTPFRLPLTKRMEEWPSADFAAVRIHVGDDGLPWEFPNGNISFTANGAECTFFLKKPEES